jgi:hypothetical protein
MGLGPGDALDSVEIYRYLKMLGCYKKFPVLIYHIQYVNCCEIYTNMSVVNPALLCVDPRICPN